MANVASAAERLVGRLRVRLATEVAFLLAPRQSRRLACSESFQRILVLCYGNIYRSPFVAEYLRRALEASGESEIRSAGFHPEAGRASPAAFVAFVRDQAGLDLSGHRSRVVSEDDLGWADVIVIMDRHNWHALARTGWRHRSKALWLGTLGGNGRPEIEDPYGKP
jgi:protein-tyrosine phosphatase